MLKQCFEIWTKNPDFEAQNLILNFKGNPDIETVWIGES